MKHEDIEDYDDPISLFDCSNLLDAGIIEPESSERTSQHNLKYKLSLKSGYMLPVSFFDIPRNIVLLNECQHIIRVTLVDIHKHPWYLKTNMRQSSESNKTDSIIHIDNDNVSDIICLDTIDSTDKIPAKVDTEVIDLTSSDRTNKKSGNFLEKRRKTINGKLDLELQNALSQKHSANIDIKRNKGLIGIKITRRITVDNTSFDRNNAIECNNDKNEEGNKNSIKIHDTETFVKSVDNVMESVGTIITPILEDKTGNVTSTVNNCELETKPPSENNNNSNTKCQLTNLPTKILEKVLKLKKASEAKNNNVQITFDKPVKPCEVSSSFISNKYKEKFFYQNETNFNHKNEPSKQRPMPKSKKLLENIKNKSREVKEKNIEKQDDMTGKRKESEISGIISPILPCNTASKKGKMLKKFLKPNVINEPKKKHTIHSVFEINKHNFKKYGSKKTIDTYAKPRIKMSEKNSKIKPSSGENKKDISKEKTPLQLINSQSTQMQNNNNNDMSECSEIAKKLLQSIVNHEISTQSENNETVRKQNMQKITRKDDPHQQVLLKSTNELEKNGKDIPNSHNSFTSDTKGNVSISGERKMHIVSVENGGVCEYINRNENVKTVAAPQNMKSTRPTHSAKGNMSSSGERKMHIVSVETGGVCEYINRNNNVKTVAAPRNIKCTRPIHSAAQKLPESIELQRPLRTKTPHQHQTVSQNISNLDRNPRINIPCKVSVINKQASAIILRPAQLKTYSNTSIQPIQVDRSYRYQYPNVTNYPTLDKLLSKTNIQLPHLPPNQHLLPPNEHLLPPNQEVYQYHNIMRSPPHYNSIAPNVAPVASSVFPNNFGAPNLNPHWNYGYHSIIPPPPPPPPPPQPPSPPGVIENYNPNILTDIQPKNNSSIIGRNVNGLVKKINIIKTTTPPLQPEHDTKEGIVKLEPTCPQNVLLTALETGGGLHKTVTNEIQKPVCTKSEMLEELERCSRAVLKRPHSINSAESIDPQLDPKKMKLDPLPTSSNRQTVKIPRKGYSPPILPIPTYQSFMSQVNSNMQNINVEKPKVTLRNPIAPCNRAASTNNVNPSNMKVTKRNNDKEEKPAKKISIADYKKRCSPCTDWTTFTRETKQRGNGNA